MDGDIITIHGAVKAAWINTILKGIKQLIQENLHTFVTTAAVGWFK